MDLGVRLNCGDCDAAEPTGDRCGSGDAVGKRAGVLGAFERGLPGGLPLGWDIATTTRTEYFKNST